MTTTVRALMAALFVAATSASAQQIISSPAPAKTCAQAVDEAYKTKTLNDTVAICLQADQRSGQGDIAALEALGMIYFDGQLSAPDPAKSLGYFTRGMRLGSLKSTYYAGLHYDGGLGVTREALEAQRLITYAADGGYEDAKIWLSKHSEYSLKNLKQNRLDIFKDIPLMAFTSYTQPAADGTTTVVDFRDRIFGGWLFPDRAMEAEMNGITEIDCHANASAKLDNCLVLSEEPRGYGFASATLREIYRRFNIIPDQREKWVAAYAGKAISIKINWQLGKMKPPRG